MGDWIVVLITLAAALAFAVSTSLKHVSAGQVPDAQDLHPSKLMHFILATLAHPLWLGGVGADVVGLSLQILALHLGALSVVQPLLVSGLLFALLIRQRHEHNITGREIAWAVVLTVALAGFFWLGRPANPSVHGTVDRVPAVAAAAIGLVLALVCVLLGRRLRHGGRSAALLGVAVGMIYAAVAALLKAVTDIALNGPIVVLGSWQPYAVVVLGATGLLLNQLAFQAGPLTASLPAISTVDPLLSIALGILVYDEQIHRGPAGGAVLVLMLLLMGTASIQLARAEGIHEQLASRSDPPS